MGFPCQEYALPFENEAGKNLTIDLMRQLVVVRKIRPRIQEWWIENPGLAIIVDIMQNCWCNQNENRISIEVVVQRIDRLINGKRPLL